MLRIQESAYSTVSCHQARPIHSPESDRVSVRYTTILCVFCLQVGCAGIGTSKWANDDPVYAEKYASNYSSNDGEKAARMLKQAIDARHVDGRSGGYVGFSGADEPTALGAEIGAFTYVDPAVEVRAGLKGLLGTGADDWFAGLDLGARVQSPSRLAPFAGVGTFIGGNGRQVGARDDNIDNDDDGAIDERGETRTRGEFIASVYPELGVHYWLTSGLRMTGSAQYHVTTDGRDSDFWFIGLSFSWLNSADSIVQD